MAKILSVGPNHDRLIARNQDQPAFQERYPGLVPPAPSPLALSIRSFHGSYLSVPYRMDEQKFPQAAQDR